MIKQLLFAACWLCLTNIAIGTTNHATFANAPRCQVEARTLATQTKGYVLSIQLNKAKEGIAISLEVPTIQEKHVYFVLPLPEQKKSLPLKKTLKNIALYDAQGKTLPYEFYDDHTLLISQAQRLRRIEYVLPTLEFGKNTPHYLLSRNGYFGYIAGYTNYPYTIFVAHPPNLYGASALPDADNSPEQDRFELPNYAQLLHSIVLYAPADTLSFVRGKTRYHIAVHSETGKITARQVRYPVEAVVETTVPYLPDLPPDYHFIFTFGKLYANAPLHDISAYSGFADRAASFYALPEVHSSDKLYGLVQPQTMHELLHSITPFNLRSQKVDNANWDSKGIGKHLWLYEGVTEYLSQLLLLRGNMQSETEFWHEMSRRIGNADRTQDAILTELSEHIYQRQQATARYVAYNRGTVVAFYLDVLLHNLSQKQGAKSPLPHSLLALLAQLSQQHPNQTFEDDSLFSEISAHTSPEIGHFLQQYVAGNEPLPHQQIATLLGMQYTEQLKETVATFGDFSLLPDYKKERLFFSPPQTSDKKFKSFLPIERGDMLLTLNGDTITTTNINQYWHLLRQPAANKALVMSLWRKGHITALSAMPQLKTYYYRHAFRPLKYPSEQATQLKNDLFNKP
jgi:predicted metalloprotease with PDZ domain